ncbi:MAG: DNA repair exonuclease [Oscillospiraceae bacterium]|jgi:exonuclease SbcD|nr:DNA repair exonuclease [Oscillospiraceae bacterium]
MVRILHAGDFHLDSAFGALTPEQARQRRAESRRMPERMVDWANDHGVQLLLLAGDLFDGDDLSGDTAKLLARALGGFQGQVVIAPGNHDPYTARSAYARTLWPDNVHIFTEDRMQTIPFPQYGCAVHGAAFTAPEETADRVLSGFTAPDDGLVHIGLLHGELTGSDSRYRPLTTAAVAASGLHYLALGHVHGCTGVLRMGSVSYAYCGCPEGRGFDELGDKGFLAGQVSPEGAELQFVPFARRRYRIMEVDVTDGDPAALVSAALPAGAEEDIYRVVLTGSPAAPVSPERVQSALSGRCCALQVRDKTTARQELWDKCGEDTLRGLFLQQLRSTCGADPQSQRLMEQAAAFGLAAIDDREV